jgi:hypothetical protein
MFKQTIKKLIVYLVGVSCCVIVQAQTGNKVFTGAEMVNFGTISLSTPGGQSWTTDRLATPGYFGATNGATYSNASDANNINGYVKKYGNQAFIFPVGDGSDLRTLAIGAPTLTTDAYATAWILGNPSGNLDPTGPGGGTHNVLSVTFPIKTVSTIGQWDWQAGVNMGTTGDGVNLLVTVSMPDMTAFATTSSLRLVGWNGSSWIDLSGMATATGNTENSSIFGYMQAGISAIGIGSIWWILPVKLTAFTAQEKNCGASLNWTSSNEENMDRFEIEQSSNGNTYQKIGAVTAIGSINENKYAFTANQTETEGYYRLKMFGKDGSFTYSPVEHVKISCVATTDFVKVYPNPVSEGHVYLDFSSQRSATAKIMLVNTVGQRVAVRSTAVKKGRNIIKFDVNHVPKGVYFIQLISDDNSPVFQPQKIIME